MILDLKGIYKDYQQGKMTVPVLKDVDFSMEEGEYVAIMGPSGSGKTTLMNIIGCLDLPTSGSYELAGQDVLQCKDRELADVRLNSIGFVFQSFHLLPRESALENVALPLIYAGVKKPDREKRAAAALDRVGLADRVEFKPTQLSGGQKQRIGIARALALEPKLIICDEAVSALDVSVQAQVLNLLQELKERLGLTYFFISHNLNVVYQVSDRVGVMYLGKMVEIAAYDQLYEKRYHPYTEALLSAIPQVDADDRTERIQLNR